MDNNNFATALSAQIQISIALIGTVKKPSAELWVLTKRWGITSEKQKSIQAAMQRGIKIMFHSLFLRWFRMNDTNLCYSCLAYPVFSDMMFASTVSRRVTDVHKYMSQTLNGLKLSQWHQEVKHIRPYNCCLLGMVSCQLVHATMPERWYKVSSTRS